MPIFFYGKKSFTSIYSEAKDKNLVFVYILVADGEGYGIRCSEGEEGFSDPVQ
jgi:hypothetical protein